MTIVSAGVDGEGEAGTLGGAEGDSGADGDGEVGAAVSSGGPGSIDGATVGGTLGT
jgi:hypothetical protein